MDDPALRTTRSPSLRGRAARLGWLTAGLVVLSLVLLAVAAWQLTTTAGQATVPDTAVLPLSVEFRRPGLAVLLAAVALVAATFLALTALETATAMQVLNRDRRIPPPLPAHLQQARRWTLGPVAVRALDMEHPPEWPALAVPGEDPAPGTRLRCTVLVPAHDEEAVIGATLRSLADQTRRPDRILVIADNCTDATGDVARACGAEVVETVGNTEKKAGALNQQLALLLPSLDAEDVVLVMDADSTISPDFLETALGLLEDDADLMAVGGLFFGEEGGGLVGQLQRNEFGRYQRIVARRLDRVFVLTGTASVIRGFALSAVAQARGSLIPGPPGEVYDTLALTEDNELTLALKTLGAQMTSPHQCRVTTEVMTRWRDLWRQRLRWHRGALENIGAYGFTRGTAMYWTQQLALGYGVVALWSYALLLVITVLAADSIRWSPFWVTIGLVFLLERLVTVWAVGWRARALAAPVVIELAYAFFLQACFVTSIVQMATGRKAGWNYVARPALQAAMLPVLAAYVVAFGIVLPSSLLLTDWYRSLSIWVAFNTLVFVVLSLLQLLPPLRRDARRAWARRGDGHARAVDMQNGS